MHPIHTCNNKKQVAFNISSSIHNLLHRGWEVELQHFYREANRVTEMALHNSVTYSRISGFSGLRKFHKTSCKLHGVGFYSFFFFLVRDFLLVLLSVFRPSAPHFPPPTPRPNKKRRRIVYYLSHKKNCILFEIKFSDCFGFMCLI